MRTHTHTDFTRVHIYIYICRYTYTFVCNIYIMYINMASIEPLNGAVIAPE